MDEVVKFVIRCRFHLETYSPSLSWMMAHCLRFEHCWVFHNYYLSPWGLGMTFSAFVDEASCWVWTLVLNYYNVVWWSHGAKKIHCCEFPVLLTELVKNLVAPWFSHQEIFPSNLAHDINLHASNILKKQSSGGVLWKKLFLEVSENPFKMRLWHRCFLVNFLVKFLKVHLH